MKLTKSCFILLAFLTSGFAFAADKEKPKSTVPFNKTSPTHIRESDVEFKFNLAHKGEVFFGEWTTYLNDAVKPDQFLFARHTLDAKVNASYGFERFGCKVVEMGATMRNKAIWGTPDSIAQTTKDEIPSVGTTFGAHNHFLHKHFFWMLDAWVKFSLDHAFRCNDGRYPEVDHFIKFGYFPFELGRGISLGSAYAVNSKFLGFFGKDSIVDQFAPGFLISGKCLKNRCNYDFYLSTVDNKDSNLDHTKQKIYSQMYEERTQVEGERRGAFHIGTITAARLKCKVVDQPVDKGTAELYGMWFHDPEQRVELPADARTNLYTVGVSGEFNLDKIEFGFDGAKNFGSQFVLAIDRNKKTLEENKNAIGAVTLVNSHVVLNDSAGEKQLGAPYAVNTNKNQSVQKLINDCNVGECFNGKQVGLADETMAVTHFNNPATPDTPASTSYKIYNASDRFRGSYRNKFAGSMFVGDVTYWAKPKELSFSAAFGYASGDDNPQLKHEDKTFGGFIPVQSVYSGGSKVRSYFVLGSNSVSRIFSFKRQNSVAAKVSGFTDLMFTAICANWKTSTCGKKWEIHPNALIYWKSHTLTEYLDCNHAVIDPADVTCNDRKIRLSRFLGTELNLFASYFMFECLEAFFAGSVFLPGTHYSERKGELVGDFALGDNVAFSMNFGFNYKF